ncbi:hypothetical protein GCM10011506_24850 [Marivirga lumbricoides]|uniref:DUF4834 domain-containing protein n=1 Tax=Marivirga lumbricoides TaxID=1046115 RepID=A0A2T4DQ90_9BACT|nr:DUF4834 domain-containing protein [Marivirga lumbricoides]GGC38425.1 hypothetical protein GCM10011506_24850 [Marivirga lumbricoides]
MFKVLLITFLIGYIFFKVGGFLFRIFLGGLGAKYATQNGRQHFNNQSQQKKKTADGINIEFVPEDDKNKRSASNFKGGEYVDYEEIK